MKNENLKENNEILVEKIFEKQKILISEEWSENRRKVFEEVAKMQLRQNSLSIEQARIEAFEQAERIKSERIKKRMNG
ncbi:hypothetical protein [Flavobacterium sp.]|uniref:hypothetical protein n=1 Tax=Flavobacterium sp. TaxID=239 RepID=UPI003342449F